MCPGNGTSQSALGIGLANVPWEWDYPICPGNGTSKCALGMGLSNVQVCSRAKNGIKKMANNVPHLAMNLNAPKVAQQLMAHKCALYMHIVPIVAQSALWLL